MKNNTDFYEISQLMGLVCDDSRIEDIDKFFENGNNDEKELSKILEKIQNIVSYGYDWKSKGVDIIKKLTIKDKAKVKNMFCLMKGMYSFRKKVIYEIIPEPRFIHGGIKNYYKAEKEILGKIEGTKENTADCLILNCSPDKFFDAIKNGEKIEPNNDLGYVKVGDDIIFIPVSLKKSKNDSQIGKVTSFLTKNRGFGVDNETAVFDLTGSSEGDIIKELEKSYNVTNDLIKKICELSKSNEKVFFEYDELIDPKKPVTSKSSTTKKTEFRLISNYRTLKVISDLINDTRSIEENVSRIIAEMIFFFLS
jgi:hypothetical protein